MPHQRYRPYEHSLTHNGEDFDYELAMAVRAGNRVWVRGQTGLDLDGNFIGEGDPAAQAETAMRCTDTLLREAGASLSDIVKLTVYLTDREYRVPVFSVLAKWLKGVRPCQTGLIVNGLARPEMLMEIDVEAVIDVS
ncbi:Rid family hydrolase [Thalassospiraceae bacterium LMO-JJ14]|nr:Rid family hydrolase [Thalassospiraceae bacterium LMO-JJ14]